VDQQLADASCAWSVWVATAPCPSREAATEAGVWTNGLYSSLGSLQWGIGAGVAYVAVGNVSRREGAWALLYALCSKRGSGLGLYKAVGCYSVVNSVIGSTYDPRGSSSARTTHYNSFSYCNTQ
jgi:hypothetical protein